ncbi:hypothetical protein [uncultured Campylobacter sp.]|uniref:hypothetical protein n=1 Tax=uncultured Campylobacter sp. TaxID=218934 RepID=UPI0026147A59|nr:hypothetical protein [uncultured Campylobacter sp.]
MQCDFFACVCGFEALGNFDLLAEFSDARFFETMAAGFWVFSAKVFGELTVLWL